jgi:ABC-type transport system involved in cytochrome c biogenesis permease subunit
MNLSFFQAALFIYLLGTAISLAYLVSLRRPLSRLGTIALGVGFTVHTLALLLRYIEAGYTPITNLHESLSFFSWSIVGVYFILYWKYRVDVLAAFISPMAAVLIILASLFPKEILPVAPVLDSFWLPIHVIFAFIGDAMFALAFAAGIMYLIQERQIKSNRSVLSSPAGAQSS